jgi:putative endonuclease
MNYYVYIATNKRNTVLYTGMTNNLNIRMFTHKEGFKESFTKRYNICKLVYYELFDTPTDAIVREKQLK